MDVERSKLALGDAQQRLRRAGSEGSREPRRRRNRTWRRGNARSRRSRPTSSWPSAGSRRCRCWRRPTGRSASCRTIRASGPMGPAQEFRAGDRAWPGAQILELPDLTSIHLATRIDEADRGQLKTDQTATIRVDAIPDREYQGVSRRHLDARARRLLVRAGRRRRTSISSSRSRTPTRGCARG